MRNRGLCIPAGCGLIITRPKDRKLRLANSTSILTQGVIDLGLAHEKAILEKLSQDYVVHEALSVTHTMELMEQGVDVIYQAQLLDEEERFIGFPDFLFRHESGQYQTNESAEGSCCRYCLRACLYF